MVRLSLSSAPRFSQVTEFNSPHNPSDRQTRTNRGRKEIFMQTMTMSFASRNRPLRYAAAALIWIPLALGALAQEASQELDRPAAAGTAAVVPQQVRYAGKLAARAGETVEAEFRIYAAEQGGEPLWTEAQPVPVSLDGSYAVLLGSSSQAGLPQAVFAGGAARWLGVSVDRSPEQERVLLSSVPYAMKSADAESLAGHAASEFVTQAQLAAVAAQSAQTAAAVEAGKTAQPQIQLQAQPQFQPLTNGALTGSGTSGNIPLWNGQYTEGNSDMVQVGSEIGINVTTPASTLDVGGGATVRGVLDLPATATATTAGGHNSQLVEASASTWSTTAAAPVAQNFGLEAAPIGNNTASPSGSLLLLYSAGTNPLAPTGFSIGSNGRLTFAAGQTFPGAIGSVTGTSPITAATSSGAVTVGINTGALETILNAVYPKLTGTNSFHGAETINGTLDLTSTLTGTYETLTGALTADAGVVSENTVYMKTAGTATTTTGYASPVFWFGGSAYNTTLSAAQAQNFVLQEFVTGNDTAVPSGYLAFEFGQGTAAVKQTGLQIGSSGVITFAPSQTFPIKGTGGGTITGITTSSPLTGSGTLGSVALGLNQGALVTNITPSLETTFDSIYPQLGSVNTFTYGQIIEGPSTIAGSVLEGPMLQVSNSGDSFSTGISVSNGGKYGTGLLSTAASNGDGIQGMGTQSAGSIGVLGALSNSNGFSNSYFLLESGDGLDAGVWADGANGQEAALIATSDDLSAGIFYNDSPASSTIVVLNNYSGGPTGNAARGIGTVLRAGGPGGTCGINQMGNLACTGQVKAVISTRNGARQLETYAVQSAENWVEDYGSGQLEHGSATIQVEPAFAETVNTGVDFHVFLTPGGDCKGLYVTNKSAGSFEVHELGGGSSSIPFDYKIVAKRNGMESQRLVDVSERMRAETETTRLKKLDHPLPRQRMVQPRRTAAPANALQPAGQ